MADVEYGSLVRSAEAAIKKDVPVERKWELGVVILESDLPGSERAAPFTSPSLLRGAFAEMVGMIFFLFHGITIARFAHVEDPAGTTLVIAFGFGIAILVLVYLLAEVSGAHLNPAVSMGLLVGKRISLERFAAYVVFQLLGATAGASIANIFLEESGGGFNHVAEGITPLSAFMGEVICTALLILVVLAATDAELGRKNGFTPALLPLAIGFTVLLAHLALIPIDGCSINPARTFATSWTNNNWDDHWVFWAGPMLGGALATIAWESSMRPPQPV